MRKYLAIPLILGMMPLAAGEDDWTLNNHFSLWAQWVRLRRQGKEKQKLIWDAITGTSNTCEMCLPSVPCKQGSLVKKFTYENGWRVGATYMTQSAILEASYLWMGAWHGHCGAVDAEGIFFSLNHADQFFDYSAADQAHAHYESNFQTGELNYFQYSSPRRENYFAASWMAGFRYFYIPENFELAFILGTDRSTYRTSATNHIYGVQAGGTIQWNPTRTFTWDLIGKLGVGWDLVHNHVYQGDYNNTVILRDYSATKYAFPFTLDTLLTVSWQPWSWLNLHVGGEFIYLNGVATAPSQVTKHITANHHIRAKAQVYYYGMFGGVGFCW